MTARIPGQMMTERSCSGLELRDNGPIGLCNAHGGASEHRKLTMLAMHHCPGCPTGRPDWAVMFLVDLVIASVIVFGWPLVVRFWRWWSR